MQVTVSFALNGEFELHVPLRIRDNEFSVISNTDLARLLSKSTLSTHEWYKGIVFASFIYLKYYET